MPDIDNVMGVDSADIDSIFGVARADIDTVMGVTVPSLGDWKGTRTFYFGGRWYNSSGSLSGNISNQIQYKTMTTDGNMADFADCTIDNHNALASGSNGTRILRMGGDSTGETDNDDQVTIDYWVAASAVNALDAGDLSDGGNRGGSSGSSNGTLCFAYGGDRYPGEGSPNYSRDQIEYQNIGTTGGATDGGGDLTAASYAHETSNGDSKALIIGISTSSSGTTTSVIDEHTFSTSGNASNYGSVDTKGHKNGAAIMCSTSRVVIAGGQGDGGVHNEVQYLPVASDSDSTDAMDLTYSGWGLWGTSDGTRGEAYGGVTGSWPNFFMQNDIQKLTLASLSGTASEIGDLANEDSDASHDYGETDAVFGGGAQTGILA